MQTIEAIYQNGVFKPLRELDLPENEQVVLSVEKKPAKEEALAWARRMMESHERFAAERGYLPDSTLDIAEDRMRDV